MIQRKRVGAWSKRVYGTRDKVYLLLSGNCYKNTRKKTLELRTQPEFTILYRFIVGIFSKNEVYTPAEIYLGGREGNRGRAARLTRDG